MNVKQEIMAFKGKVFLRTLLMLKSLVIIPGIGSFYRLLLIRLVKKSQLFDEAFYVENNQDVAQSTISPIRHYILKGDREGRSPMPFFDPGYYRSHTKSKTKKVNALLHYSYIGRYQRVPTSPWFDLDYYLSNNKDVARSNQDPLLHYLRWGGLEGRSPSPHFDGLYYLKANPQVQLLHINPLLHYLYYGRQEGLKPLPHLAKKSQVQSNNNELLWDSLTKRSNPSHAGIDIIIPVYQGQYETLQCLHSVLSSPCNITYELIVIDDASPDFELTEQLRKLANKGLFKLISNSTNQGFVHTVNRGMSLHKDRDVVLLNSDTEVYNDWLERLATAAYRNRLTGTVTPLSNNATICSYPRFLHDNPYPLEIGYADLDALNAKLNKDKQAEAPTGVGFCMYIKRECLDVVGLFDEEAFGRGYGEENDFCQRAIRAGWRNVIAADVFVRHWGACSFKGERAKRVQNALKIIDSRYPNYQNDVSAFIKTDPLSERRRILDWNRLLLMRREKNILLINHNRGGGSERRVQEDIQRFINQGFGVFLLRPYPNKPKLGFISHPKIKSIPNLLPFHLDQTKTVIKLLKNLNITEIHTHSFVDFSSNAPEHFIKAIDNLKLYLTANLHDYTVICPRINLADENGVYCGEPDDTGCNKCLKERKSIFETTTINAWRTTQENILLKANKVIVPSGDVASRLQRYFPKLEVNVAPHEIIPFSDNPIQHPKLKPNEKLRIIIIGAIGKLKGYDVIRACAKHAKRNALPLEFILMGYCMNDRIMEEAGVEITGQYQDSEALDVLNSLNPHVVWLPSLWPETYSYTLSIALQANLPVFAFDIGAIAERLVQFDRAKWLMDLSTYKKPSTINNLFEKFRRENVLT